MSPNPHDGVLTRRSAWTVPRAFALSILAASMTSLILLWVAQPYSAVWPNYAKIFGLYPPFMALLFGVPGYFLTRRRAGLPRWLIVPAAGLGAAAPLAALFLLAAMTRA